MGTVWGDAARERIGGFVAARFSLRGSARLHRHALGWDLLRAPANVALAPVHLILRGVAWASRRPAPRLAGWIDRHPLILRTGVAREVEALVVRELLGFPPGRDVADSAAQALRAALPEADAPGIALRADRIARTVGAYCGTRSAVAEITTALIALGLGAALFHSLTPGMLSMAPAVARTVALERAIEGFPLGAGLGSMWYGVFPVGASPWLVAGVAGALVMAASALTAFAGLLADPVQRALGLHRRRLLRLVASVEADMSGTLPRPFAAREHLWARLADLSDLGAGLLRLLR